MEVTTFIYERLGCRHRLDVAGGRVSFDGGLWHGEATLGRDEIVLRFHCHADETKAAQKVFVRVEGTEVFRYEDGDKWSATIREALPCKCCPRLLTLAAHEKWRGVCWPEPNHGLSIHPIGERALEPQSSRSQSSRCPEHKRGRPCAANVEFCCSCWEPSLDCECRAT